jgi:hypothetical protein
MKENAVIDVNYVLTIQYFVESKTAFNAYTLVLST